MVSRMTDTWCSHCRSCQPITIAGLEAPNAISTRLPVSEATELAPSASPTGVRTPTARGPIFKVIPGARSPIAVASANAS